jgi:hypothetical protein
MFHASPKRFQKVRPTRLPKLLARWLTASPGGSVCLVDSSPSGTFATVRCGYGLPLVHFKGAIA